MKKMLLLAAAVFAGISAFAQDVTVQPFGSDAVPTSGTSWTSTTAPAVKLTTDGTFVAMDGVTDLCIGTGSQKYLTISSVDPAYYVSGFSFSAAGYSGDEMTVAFGGQTITTSSETQAFSATGIAEGTAAKIILTPNPINHNKKLVVSNLTVTLSPATGDVEVSYATGHEGETLKRSDRSTTQLTISDNIGSPALVISSLQSSTDHNLVFDKTSEVFTTKAGATVSVAAVGSGSWMQRFIYVDWAGDGFKYESDDDYLATSGQYALKEGADLVAYNGHNFSGHWFDSKGNALSGGGLQYSGTDTFVIPEGTPAGSYRVRFKNDWNTFNPQGATDVLDNGGIFVDFTIVVEEGQIEIPEPEPIEVLAPVTDITSMIDGAALSRTGWTVSGCGQRGAPRDSDGGFAQLMDDNTSTFWHSEWSADKTAPHYLVFDLGENPAGYGAFGYLPRQSTNANGYVTSYRLYVLNSIEGLALCDPNSKGHFQSGSHASLNSFIADLTPTCRGTFDCNKSDQNSLGLKQVVFANENTTMRYVLFVIDDTDNDEAANKHANCAEFYLYSVREVGSDLTAEAANTQLAEARTEATSLLELYRGILTTAEINSYAAAIAAVADFTTATVTEVELLAALESIQSAFSHHTGIAAAAGRVITVKNARRAARGQSSYLTITSAPAINTAAGITELGKWMILPTQDGEAFRLFNVETRSFLGEDMKASTTNPAEAQVLTLAATTAHEGAVALKFNEESNGLNVDTGGSDLTQYGYTDGGSSWYLATVGVEAADLDTTGSKYYRIRSDRGMWNHNTDVNSNRSMARGSLLGIKTAVEDGVGADSESYVAMSHDGLGTLWKIVATDNDAVYLYNAAADYEGNDQLLGLGSGSFEKKTMAKMSATPIPVKILKAHGAAGSGYQGRIPYAVGIMTNFDTNKYLDIDGNVRTANGITVANGGCVNEWTPENKVYNDGSLYYVEEATDADAVIASYLAKAGLTETEALAPIAGLGKATNIWDAEAVANAEAAIKALELGDATFTTVKEANANYVDAETREAVEAAHNEALYSAVGRNLRFTNVQHGFLLSGSSAGMAHTTYDYMNTTIWTVEGTLTAGVYRLLNYGQKQYMGFTDDYNTRLPWDEEGGEFEFVIPTSCDGYTLADDNQVGIKLASGGDMHFIHGVTQNFEICRWELAAAASQWMVTLAEEDGEELIPVSSTGAILLTHDNGVTHLYGRPDEDVALLAPVTLDEPEVETYALGGEAREVTLTEEGDALQLDLTSLGLEDGAYRLTLPVAFAKVGGKYSKPLNYIFVKEGSEITRMDEITANGTAAPVEYFNLQGQRVAAPANGIFLMRQGTTVTKIVK